LPLKKKIISHIIIGGIGVEYQLRMLISGPNIQDSYGIISNIVKTSTKDLTGRIWML
jgi:hypothetical protein